MNTSTKLALAAALLVGTTSFAAAQGFDPNLANRYPAYADPVASTHSASRHVATTRHGRALQSAPVGLYQGRAHYQSRDVALPTGAAGYGGNQNDWFSVETNDRASSPYAGGGF